jgi:hypothetical protein
MKGAVKATHEAAVATSEVEFHVGNNYNALLVMHEIDNGGGAGGYVSLTIGDKKDGTYIAHHGEGSNIKAADQAASYTCIFKGVSDTVKVKLNRTSGTHNVRVQPINV